MQQKEFQRIKELKNILTPELLCESPEAKILQPFIEDVFQLGFNDTPDYDKLRFLLVKGILNLNETPSKEFDWNENFAHDTDVINANMNSSNEEADNLDIGDEDAIMANEEEKLPGDNYELVKKLSCQSNTS